MAFSHDSLPDSWNQIVPAPPNTNPTVRTFSQSNLTLAVQKRDASCRITGHDEITEITHLISRKKKDWWAINGMRRYNTPAIDLFHSLSNNFLLRKDLHTAFDKSIFVFVPRPEAQKNGSRLVVHVLEPSSLFEAVYHNHNFQDFRARLEMVFARFDWSIFPLAKGFLTSVESRRLR